MQLGAGGPSGDYCAGPACGDDFSGSDDDVGDSNAYAYTYSDGGGGCGDADAGVAACSAAERWPGGRGGGHLGADDDASTGYDDVCSAADDDSTSSGTRACSPAECVVRELRRGARRGRCPDPSR